MTHTASSQEKSSGSLRIAALAVALTLTQVLVLVYCIANPGELVALGFTPDTQQAMLAIMALCAVNSAVYAWYAWPRRITAKASIGG